MLAVLAECQESVHRRLTTPITLVPRDPVPFSGLMGTCMHMMHINTCRYKYVYINKMDQITTHVEMACAVVTKEQHVLIDTCVTQVAYKS